VLRLTALTGKRAYLVDWFPCIKLHVYNMQSMVLQFLCTAQPAVNRCVQRRAPNASSAVKLGLHFSATLNSIYLNHCFLPQNGFISVQSSVVHVFLSNIKPNCPFPFIRRHSSLIIQKAYASLYEKTHNMCGLNHILTCAVKSSDILPLLKHWNLLTYWHVGLLINFLTRMFNCHRTYTVSQQQWS